MSHRRAHTTVPRGRRAAVAGSTLLSVAVLAGCDAGSATPAPAERSSSGATSPQAAPERPSERPAKGPAVTTNVRAGEQVPVDHLVEVGTEAGRLTEVTVTSSTGEVPGELGGDGARWAATGRLEPGTAYVVRARAEGPDGTGTVRTTRFRTQDLTLDQQTFASVAPLAGETVGVGMPVIVTFDVPVTDQASIEQHLSVSSSPRQAGAWHWLSATEVHWRPREYWQPGTDVTVDVDVNSVAAGAGIYGQESRQVQFHVGAANVYKVDAGTHQMQVLQNGELLRTIPITTGKAGFTTRSGTKVIMEKFETRRMNSETVGIPAGSAEAYDIDDVQYAMRLTYSGEFIHAAPWSVGSQGSANVSHGCTGMSTANAAWLYSISKRGDVVQYTGTDRPMTLENGYGDWNTTWADYRAGSALG